MRYYLLVFLSFFLTVQGGCQTPGLAGKKMIYGFGASYNPQLFYKPKSFIHDSLISHGFPLSLKFQAERTTSINKSIDLEFTCIPKSLSQFYIKNNEENWYYGYNTLLVDTFLLQTQYFSLATNYRKYKNFSLYGKYFLLGSEVILMNSLIYPTTYMYQTYGINVLQHYIQKRKHGVENSYNMNIHIGKGRKIYVKDNICIDYGIKLYALLRAKSIKTTNVDIEYYRENIKQYVEYVNNKQYTHSHFIELYCNIQLLN